MGRKISHGIELGTWEGKGRYFHSKDKSDKSNFHPIGQKAVKEGGKAILAAVLLFALLGFISAPVNSSLARADDSCVESWSCTAWGKCNYSSNLSYRSCYDAGSCGSEDGKPVEEAKCESAFPLCHDGLLNQDEGDTDCGGEDCQACGVEKSCKSNSDCESELCLDGACSQVYVGSLPAPSLNGGSMGFGKLLWVLFVLAAFALALIIKSHILGRRYSYNFNTRSFAPKISFDISKMKESLIGPDSFIALAVSKIKGIGNKDMSFYRRVGKRLGRRLDTELEDKNIIPGHLAPKFRSGISGKIKKFGRKLSREAESLGRVFRRRSDFDRGLGGYLGKMPQSRTNMGMSKKAQNIESAPSSDTKPMRIMGIVSEIEKAVKSSFANKKTKDIQIKDIKNIKDINSDSKRLSVKSLAPSEPLEKPEKALLKQKSNKINSKTKAVKHWMLEGMKEAYK